MAALRVIVGTACLGLGQLAMQAWAQNPDIATKCPDAMRERAELQSRRRPPPDPATVTRPALRQNLLLMAKDDQEARAFTLASGNRDPANPEVMRLEEVDSANLKRLKHIVAQDGFPTAEMVGLDGVDAAWLLTIHAAEEPDFLEEVLKLTVGHVRRGEVRSDQVAMLTDDLLNGRGKQQRYGTNYEIRDGQWWPRPIEDEANVAARRQEAGLPSLENETCVIRAVYAVPATRQ